MAILVAMVSTHAYSCRAFRRTGAWTALGHGRALSMPAFAQSLDVSGISMKEVASTV
jgi:hypothetical protein